MKRHLGILMAGLGLLGIQAPLFGHHSFAAEFDENKPITLRGVVMKVEWSNPHAHILVAVRDDKGSSLTTWDLELGSPNVLMREGWTRESLKEGEQVVVEGFRAKDGSNLANARQVTLADGRKVFAGSSLGDTARVK